MHHLARKITLLIVSFLALAGCGGGTSDSPAVDNPEDLITSTPTPAATGDFGTPVDLGTGVLVRMYGLTPFNPPANTPNFAPGSKAMTFNFEINNTSKAPVDPSAMIVTSAATEDCVDIFNADIGISGPPASAVKPGSKIDFKWAIACKGKTGDAVKVTATFDGSTFVEITGKLP